MEQASQGQGIQQRKDIPNKTIDPKLETKRIIIYLAITFLITYSMEIGFIWPMITGDNKEMATLGQFLISIVMFIPALSVVITRLITKEGLRNSLLMFNWKSHLRYYLFAWFGPTILTMLGALIYFLLNPGQFDLDMTYLSTTYQTAGMEVSSTQLKTTMLIQIGTAIVIGPLANLVTCFGEEWGWRGYLLPKMYQKFNILPVILVNGLIWGLWHAPLTALGHNYGTGYAGYPFTGILAMCIFCITLGTIFSFVTIKTKSCIPAIFAHGSLNSIASVGIFFTVDGGNAFTGPAPTGIIGGIGFLIVAVVMAVILVKEEKKKTV